MWIQYNQSSLAAAFIIEINFSKGKGIKKQKRMQIPELQYLEYLSYNIVGNNSTVHSPPQNQSSCGLCLPLHKSVEVVSQKLRSDMVWILVGAIQNGQLGNLPGCFKHF